jgi:hypothetical protein
MEFSTKSIEFLKALLNTEDLEFINNHVNTVCLNNKIHTPNFITNLNEFVEAQERSELLYFYKGKENFFI